MTNEPRTDSVMDFETMSYNELMIHKDSLIEEINKIKFQIEDAKSHHEETGEYSDSTWFRKATYALRQKQRQVQKLQWMSKEKKKSERALSQYFVDVCKEQIEDVDFEEIMAEAKRRKESETE